jgi:hypothetical protein
MIEEHNTVEVESTDCSARRLSVSSFDLKVATNGSLLSVR